MYIVIQVADAAAGGIALRLFAEHTCNNNSGR